MNEIQTVKIQGNGYLLNGSMSVPKADSNREYELIKQWLSEGNIPEPEYTEAELATIELNKKISEAKSYLAATDYKMLPHYVVKEGEDIELIIAERTSKREFVRSHE